MDLHLSHFVRENWSTLSESQSFKFHPIFRKWTKESPVLALHANGFPGSGFGMSPAGFVWVHEDALAYDGGVSAVGSVEINAFPIDKLVASVDGGKAHGVVIVNGPSVAFRDASGTGIESNGDCFLRYIDILIEWARINLVGAEKDVPKVHLFVGRDFFLGLFFLNLRHASRQRS